MKKVFALLLLSVFANPLAQAAEIKAGNWQTTITMIMPGMPFTPPPRTITHCVKPLTSEANSQTYTVEDLAKSMQRTDCSMEEFSFKDGEGHWKMQCGGKHPSTGEAWINYQSDKHYTSKVVMTLHDTGGGKMTISSDAKWIGACH